MLRGSAATLLTAAAVTNARGRSGSASASTSTLTERQTREALVFGEYQPGPGTAGVYSDVPRTQVASLTVVPGQTYENLILPFDFTPPTAVSGAPDVIFRNVEFKGNPGAPTANGALLKCWNPGRVGIQLWDCLINPQTPHFWRNGILGANFKLYRTEITRVVDTVSTYNTNDPDSDLEVAAYGFWFHDLAWYSQAAHAAGGGSSPADGSHSDGWQMQGGLVGEIIGGRIDGFIAPEFGLNSLGTNHTTSCMLIKPNVGPITDLVVNKNWFDGGAFSINFANDTPTLLGDVGEMKDNRFGRNQRVQGSGGDATFTISMPSNATGVFTGNVYADNGHPITVRHNG